MGSWGTALYSNDTSCDVRDMCNEIYPFARVEEGTRMILEEYADIVNSDVLDNDCANFWFALADWQWKHGILSTEIKAKAISLLKAHTGIEEWEESGSASDVQKRLAVMDKLLRQLELPQPPVKIPKSKVPKAKHRPGDIIVFRTCSKDYEYAETVWNIEECGFTDHYTDEVASKLPKKLSPPYEAYEKYMAVLCVGTIQEAYSKYLPNVLETRSIYAYYDYISDQKPTLEDLKQCGFLPLNIRYSDDGDSVGKNAWTYTFALFAQSFTQKEGGSEQIVNKTCCLDENERFHTLFSQKHYDTEYVLLPNLFAAFSDIYDEKVRLEWIGVELDDLLDANQSNPDLRTPEEINKIVSESVKEWQRKEYELIHSEEYQNADETQRIILLRALVKDDME